METGEFSFYLAPSSVGGVGVFAAHDIKKGTLLTVYGEPEEPTMVRRAEDVPERFRGYFVWCKDGMMVPPDVRRMAVAWYLNHSCSPNAAYSGDYDFRAVVDIPKDTEIFIDYRTLGEPEDKWEWFYRSPA